MHKVLKLGKSPLFLRVLLHLLLSYVLSTVHAFATVSIDKQGTIRAYEVYGVAFLIDKETGFELPLMEGMELHGGHSIETSPNSSVILHFSNGAGIYLYGDSLLTIEKYYQIPFDSALGEYKTLKTDPSPSYAWIKLEHGELSGHVKKLRDDSSFIVETPDAFGDIRGTIFGFKHSDKYAEGDTSLSEISVFEGSVATVAKTNLSSSQLTALRNFDNNDLTPFETMLGEVGTSQTLSITNQPNRTTLVLSNALASELSNFDSFINDFAEDLGVGETVIKTAINNAYGAKTPSTATGPTKYADIQSSTFNTENGKGFQIDTKQESTDFATDTTSKTSEAIMGLEQTDPTNGDVRTTSKNTTTSTQSTGGTLTATTNRTALTDETRKTDGSYTVTKKVDSTKTFTAGGTETSTYLETTTGDSSKTVSDITQTTVDKDGNTITKTYKITNEFDSNGKLTKTTEIKDGTTTETTPDTSGFTFSKDTSSNSLKFTATTGTIPIIGTGPFTSTTTTEPVTGSVTVSTSIIEIITADPSVPGETDTKKFVKKTKTYSLAQDGNTQTTTVVNNDGTTSTITDVIEIDTGTPDVAVTTSTTTLTRTANGGYINETVVETTSGTTTTTETTTFTRTVYDNGTFDETLTVGTTTVKTTVSNDGTITVVTDDGTTTTNQTFDTNYDLINETSNPSTPNEDDDITDDIDDIIDDMDGVVSPA